MTPAEKPKVVTFFFTLLCCLVAVVAKGGSAREAHHTPRQVDASEVGWLFVQEYYTTLNRDPGNLHCFYNKKSAFLHGTEGETAKHCYGQTVGFSLLSALVMRSIHDVTRERLSINGMRKKTQSTLMLTGNPRQDPRPRLRVLQSPRLKRRLPVLCKRGKHCPSPWRAL